MCLCAQNATVLNEITRTKKKNLCWPFRMSWRRIDVKNSQHEKKKLKQKRTFWLVAQCKRRCGFFLLLLWFGRKSSIQNLNQRILRVDQRPPIIDILFFLYFKPFFQTIKLWLKSDMNIYLNYTIDMWTDDRMNTTFTSSMQQQQTKKIYSFQIYVSTSCCPLQMTRIFCI